VQLALLVCLLSVGCEINLQQPAYRQRRAGPPPPPSAPTGPSGPGGPADAVWGTASYPRDGGLPGGAELRVLVVDMSDGHEVAGATIRRLGAGETSYKVQIDPRRINNRRDYGLSATIVAGGRLLFRTPGTIMVITKGRPTHVNLGLERVGGGGGASVASGALTGNVSWTGPPGLPGNAELRIVIVDGADGNEIAHTKIRPPGRSPARFKLNYNGNKMDPGRDYLVLARIVAGNDLLFRTVAKYLVITKRRPTHVDMALERVGGGGGQTVPGGPFTGRVLFDTRRALPRGAELRVEIVDLSDGRSVASDKTTNPGGPPIPFQVKYNANRLDPGRDYGARARITLKDDILFRSFGDHLIITKGRPTRLDLQLNRVGGGP
jgi:putative lipoprotein